MLLDEHRTDVYRFLAALVGRDAADDCFQETFLAALRAYPRLRDGSNLRSWLLTIAHRKALDLHRARRRVRPLETVPERSVEPHDGDPALWKAVGALPTKQRAAIVCRFVGDLTYRDIAQVMDTSEEAARRNVHEGVKKLREGWEL